ncbi:hypothetical protein [Variovorax sp. RCC_210]|uniref:hypothetical protein n=1 Tax=Variovorax sp. RCC_210 TaxID=3239217 RepID=UPI00352387B2
MTAQRMTSMIVLSNTYSRVLLILAGVFLAGCTGLTAQQKDAVTKFGKASSSLGDTTATELKAMRQSTMQMNLERLSLSGKDKDMSNAGTPLPGPTNLDSGFELETVTAVSAATAALSSYGKALVALADDTESAELRSATDGFATNLALVPKAQLTDEQRVAIASAANGLGGFVVEAKRKRAVATLVIHAKSSVDKLCTILAQDFDPHRGWIAEKLAATSEPLLVAADLALVNGKNYDQRKAAQEGLRLAFDNRKRLDLILSGIQKTAVSMKKANETLAIAIQDGSFSIDDFLDFSEKAQALQLAVKSAQPKGD